MGPAVHQNDPSRACAGAESRAGAMTGTYPSITGHCWQTNFTAKSGCHVGIEGDVDIAVHSQAGAMSVSAEFVTSLLVRGSEAAGKR
jgi:predicted AlkP superfamily phosphohydrolase/phosphomutase